MIFKSLIIQFKHHPLSFHDPVCFHPHHENTWSHLSAGHATQVPLYGGLVTCGGVVMTWVEWTGMQEALSQTPQTMAGNSCRLVLGGPGKVAQSSPEIVLHHLLQFHPRSWMLLSLGQTGELVELVAEVLKWAVGLLPFALREGHIGLTAQHEFSWVA